MDNQETFRPAYTCSSKTTYTMVSYGLPFHKSCQKHVKETFGAKRAYIIASKTLSEKTDFLRQLQDSLGPLLVGTWIGVPNHTPADALVPIIQDARVKRADCLITLGGGSISDGAKLITLALANGVETLTDLMKMPRIGAGLGAVTGLDAHEPQIPVICIPISLSGGEYSRYAGVVDPETGFKHQFTHEKMYPALLILDPQVALSTPMSIWLSTGVRAIDHCVEGFLSQNACDEADTAAKQGLVQLVDGLLKTKKNADDLEARLNCQLGCNMSMILLFLGVMKGASHGIGHQLGPLGVGHGETSCVLLPAVCKYNAPVNHIKQEKLKKLLLEQTAARDLIKAGQEVDLGDVLRAVFDSLGMPKSLREVGIGADKLEQLARSCLDEVFVKSNPRPLEKISEVMAILEMVTD